MWLRIDETVCMYCLLLGNAAKVLGEDSSENLLYPSLAPRQLELETHSRTVSAVYHSSSVTVFLMSIYVLR